MASRDSAQSTAQIRACSCGGPETCAFPDDCARDPRPQSYTQAAAVCSICAGPVYRDATGTVRCMDFAPPGVKAGDDLRCVSWTARRHSVAEFIAYLTRVGYHDAARRVSSDRQIIVLGSRECECCLGPKCKAPI